MPRTLNSVKNLLSSVGLSLLMVLLGFVTRKLFVDSIGVEYLGLNGLLQNVLGVMTLLEGGFATSVIYNLYKPLADDDRIQILALIQLYRKVYRWIAFGVFIFSLILYPFLDIFVKESRELEYVSIVYFIFVFNSIIGYFSAYKWSLINASQKGYKLTAINMVYQIVTSISKLAILYLFESYVLFLVAESLFSVLYNIAIVRKADQLFPYIKQNETYIVDDDQKRSIVTNMKALFLHRLGGFFMHSTDNIVISSCVGIATTGFYSNYTLLIGTITTFVNQVLNSFSESVGNLIASESKEKVYDVFRVVFFVNFIVASVPVIVLYNTLEPFVIWWLGKDYLLASTTVNVILLNFYIDTMRSSAQTFKTKAGIFVQDKYSPLLQGIINLALSIWFVHLWGLGGVLLATSISVLSIGFWQFPRLCYKYVFNQPLKSYFFVYIIYTTVAIGVLVLTVKVCDLLLVDNIIVKSIINAVVTMSLVCTIYYICFSRTVVWKRLMVYVKAII